MSETLLSEPSRAYTGLAAECSSKVIRLTKADLKAHVKNAEFAVTQKLFGEFDPLVENILVRAYTHTSSEERGEVIHVHVGCFGERGESHFLVQICVDEFEGSIQAR